MASAELEPQKVAQGEWPPTKEETARMNHSATPLAPDQIGRYILHPAIARGGMATVHAARLVAAEGITRLVAAKRLHPHLTDDPEFVAMFQDEARIASRIHHPNVVPVLDVIRSEDEVILVQEYVHGVPLSSLFKLALVDDPVPIPIAAAIVTGILAGLHAAHEATDELGEPLGVVHRDVSPQNVIVSVDGIPRLVDFGIAKAKTSIHHTREGFFKGKLAYMAPEQIRAEPVTRHADIYAAGVLLWELVVNRRFYDGKNDAEFVRTVALGATPTLVQTLEPERSVIAEERWKGIVRLDEIVARAMAPSPQDRWPTALDMATAIVNAVRNATAGEVASWVRSTGAEYLDKRQKELLANEESYRAGHSSYRMAAAAASSARIEIDEGRNSGRRMRFGQGIRGEAVSLIDIGSTNINAVNSVGPTTSTSISTSSRYEQRLEARTIIPWTVIAGLLIIIGLLTGMVIVREPVTAATASTAPPVQAIVLPNLQQPAATAEPELPVIMAPAASRPPAPPPPAATTVRWVAPVKASPPPSVARPAPTPVPTPVPLPPSARPDCSPPFYFEGTKKVFKPSCL